MSSTYTFTIYREYDYEPWHDEKCIAKIELPLDWSYMFEDIYFDNEMVTLGRAIYTLKTFLSEKISQEYIDTHPQILEYFTEEIEIKGDLIGGFINIEDVYLLRGNVLLLVIGT